jgi:hypothetical protein
MRCTRRYVGSRSGRDGKRSSAGGVRSAGSRCWRRWSAQHTFVACEPTLVALGDGYRRLLARERPVGLLMLQGYAAAADETVRRLVARRYLSLQRAVAHLTGADALQLRTFFAAGLLMTVTTVLELPGRRTDATWGARLLELGATRGGNVAPVR